MTQQKTQDRARQKAQDLLAVKIEGRTRAALIAARIKAWQLTIYGILTTLMPLAAPVGTAVLSYYHMLGMLPWWASAIEAFAVEGIGFVSVHLMAQVQARNAALEAIIETERSKSRAAELRAQRANPRAATIAFAVYFITVLTLNTIGVAVKYAADNVVDITASVFRVLWPQIAMSAALALMTIPAAIIAGAISASEETADVLDAIKIERMEEEAAKKATDASRNDTADGAPRPQEPSMPSDWRKLSEVDIMRIASMATAEIAKEAGVTERTASSWKERAREYISTGRGA